MQRKYFVFGAVALVALAIACGEKANQPVSPTSPSVVGGSGAAAPTDGATLKVNGPTLVSPKGGVRITETKATLTIGAAAGKFAAAAFAYRVQLATKAGVLVQEFSGTALAYTTTLDLEPDTTFQWRARAEYDGAAGPWTGYEQFVSPERPTGYINGNEVFDPLTDGKTVGSISGPVEWVPNKGIRLLEHESRVSYQLPITLEDGEFSIMVTGIDEGSKGDKSKVMSMQEGGGDITTNDYRFTFEMRGGSYPDPGTVAFRMITGDSGQEDQIHDVPRRVQLSFSDELWYFWKARWTTNSLVCEVREGGPTGGTMFGQGVDFDHAYRPTPHVVHLGAPVGRSGPKDATVPGMIIKNVWISPRPRPAWVDAAGR